MNFYRVDYRNNRIGDWLQTYSGKRFFPLDPRFEEIDIVDIAHSLSQQCRYAGHTRGFYSVAEHCLIISSVVSPENSLWGLLHDASEAYLMDIPRPLKRYLPDYKQIEKRVMEVIATRFGLPPQEPDEVKEADTRILLNERDTVMRLRKQYYWDIPGEPLPGVVINCYPPEQAKQLFLKRFNELMKGVNYARG